MSATAAPAPMDSAMAIASWTSGRTSSADALPRRRDSARNTSSPIRKTGVDRWRLAVTARRAWASACHRALLRECKVARAVGARRRGRVAAFRVSPSKMLRHLDALAATGLSANEVARRAGVAASTLSRARHRGAMVSSLVSTAVLSVAP